MAEMLAAAIEFIPSTKMHKVIAYEHLRIAADLALFTSQLVDYKVNRLTPKLYHCVADVIAATFNVLNCSASPGFPLQECVCGRF